MPGGLIHHWIGAAFLPNLKIDDILDVTRDYDRYKNFFSPSVVDSRIISMDGPADRFSMLLMNKAFFLKTALDADYEATTVRLDSCRVYSVAKTTRVQEIDEYGHPDEHKIAEGVKATRSYLETAQCVAPGTTGWRSLRRTGSDGVEP